MKDPLQRAASGRATKMPPTGVHPLVVRFFQEIICRDVAIDKLAKRAGISRETIYRLRNGNGMSFQSFDAMLNAMDLELHIRERKRDAEV